MTNNNDSTNSLVDLQRETTIYKILRLVLYKKKDGKQYSITKATEEVGIDRKTWYNWVEEGYVRGPLQSITESMRQAAYDALIPHHIEILENIARMATGKPPAGTDMAMKPKDVLAAIKLYLTMVPVAPLDQETIGRTASDFLDEYQPQQVNIAVDNRQYLYQGGGGAPRFGDIDDETLSEELSIDVVEPDIE